MQPLVITTPIDLRSTLYTIDNAYVFPHTHLCPRLLGYPACGSGLNW